MLEYNFRNSFVWWRHHIRLAGTQVVNKMIHQNHVPFENRDKYKREENIDHRTKWTTMKLIVSLKIFSYFFFQRIISTSNHFLDRSCLHQILYKFYCYILSAIFDRSKICLEAKENLCENDSTSRKNLFTARNEKICINHWTKWNFLCLSLITEYQNIAKWTWNWTRERKKFLDSDSYIISWKINVLSF